jgi:hypothetical protein
MKTTEQGVLHVLRRRTPSLASMLARILRAVAQGLRAMAPEPIPQTQVTAAQQILALSGNMISGIHLHRHLYLVELMYRMETGCPLFGDAWSHGLTGVRLHPIARITDFGDSRQRWIKSKENENAAPDHSLDAIMGTYWKAFGRRGHASLLGFFHDIGIGDSGALHDIMPMNPGRIDRDVERLRAAILADIQSKRRGSPS